MRLTFEDMISSTRDEVEQRKSMEPLEHLHRRCSVNKNSYLDALKSKRMSLNRYGTGGWKRARTMSAWVS